MNLVEIQATKIWTKMEILFKLSRKDLKTYAIKTTRKAIIIIPDEIIVMKNLVSLNT